LPFSSFFGSCHCDRHQQFTSQLEFFMSQNIVTLDTPSGFRIEVRVGWDRPLEEIFSIVEPDENDPADYSKLHLAYYPDAMELARAFRDAGMPLPESVLAAVEIDRRLNLGNVMRTFDDVGDMLSSVTC
jgi:hypothetical protein